MQNNTFLCQCDLYIMVALKCKSQQITQHKNILKITRSIKKEKQI